MRYLIVGFGIFVLAIADIQAVDETLLARVTVYWHSEGEQQRACWNGTRLRNDHCAVDPARISYGSKVVFEDGVCLAVDTGPAVVNRKAARLTGRTRAQRQALVIDRYFENKGDALKWAASHPAFINVRILPPGTREPSRALTDLVKTERGMRNVAATQVAQDKSGRVALLSVISPVEAGRSTIQVAAE